MKMYQVEIKSDDDLIIITQEDPNDSNVIVLHREQVPVLTEWLKKECLGTRVSGRRTTRAPIGFDAWKENQ